MGDKNISTTDNSFGNMSKLFLWIIVFFCLFLLYFWSILYPFIIGVILAFLIEPFLGFFEHRHIPRFLGICITMILLVCGLSFLLAYILPATLFRIFSTLSELITKFQANKELLSSISLYLNKYHIIASPTDISGFLLSKVNPILGNAVNYSLLAVKFVVQSLKVLILAFLTLIYALSSKKAVLNNITEIVPSSKRTVVLRLYKQVVDQIYQFILSLFIVSIVVFLFMLILLHFFPDSPAPFSLALICGLLSMIPFLGGFLPPIFVFLVHLIYNTSLHSMIFILIIEIIFFCFVGMYLQPLMTGRKVKIHPLIILICIIMGGSIDGVLGVMLSVPIYITIKTVFVYYFNKLKSEGQEIEA